MTSPPATAAPHKPLPILPDHAGLWWYLWQDLLVLGFGAALLLVALKVFGRAEGNFADEL